VVKFLIWKIHTTEERNSKERKEKNITKSYKKSRSHKWLKRRIISFQLKNNSVRTLQFLLENQLKKEYL
jgi:hypothetical protein